MSRLRFSEITAASVLTPPAGKATVFLDSADNSLKVRLDDGSLVILTITQEYIEDVVGNLFQDSNTINVVYDDVGNMITLEVIPSNLNISLIPNVPLGNLVATNVQDALNELQSSIDTAGSDLTAHINDTTDAHDASAISNVPAGNLAATDVQSALNELQSDIDTRALQSSLTAHENLTSGVHGVTGTVVGTTDTQTLTNKTIDADDNTIIDLEVDNLKAGVLNTSTTLTGASNTQIPSALAVKTYVDNTAAAQNEASEISYDNTTSGLTATNVQAAIDEVESRVDTVETGLANHLADTVDAHDASAISNTPSGNLAATDVQSALNELQTDVDTRATLVQLNNHINDVSDAHDASAISVIPTGNLSSTEVQSALVELQTDIDNISAGAVEVAQDAVGSILLDSSNIDFTYNDTTPSITADLIDTAVTPGSYGTATQVSSITVDQKGRLTSASNTTIAIPSTQITDFTEATQDAIGNILTDSATVNFIYNDGANTISAVVVDGSITDVKVAAGISAAKIGAGSVDNTEFGFLDGVTSAIQTQLNNKQPLDSTLTSLAAYNTNGILVQTAADTFAGRTVTGTALNILVVNGDGVAGNPTLDLIDTGTAGTYGSASQVPVLTTDAKGRVSAVTPTLISIISSQVSDFATAVRSTVLTGVTFATNSAILATDSVLIAFGKLQSQINSHFGAGGTAHAEATNVVAGFMSAADKAKLDIISGTRIIKSGVVPGANFLGAPRTATVTFGTAFPNLNYSIQITGANARTWSFQAKAVGSFVINANANGAIAGDVTWTCISYGESVE